MFQSGLFREIFPAYHRALVNHPQLKNLLTRLLRQADTRIKQGKLSQAGALVFFLYPYLLSNGFFSPPEKPARPTREVEKRLLEILGSYRFCKELFEETLVLLSALLYYRYFVFRGKSPPKKLVRKSYFPELRELSDLIFPEERKFLKIEVRSRKKRRKRRRDA